MMAENNYLLQSALAYAVSGKPVFPCRAKNKAPLVTGGFKAATVDTEQLRSWWMKWPDALIGMPTGKTTGVFVLDVDIDAEREIDGEQSLSVLVAQYGELPETKTIRTRRGGRHLYFLMEPGIGNSTGKHGVGLDIRGEGGYVIVPPSPGYTDINDADPVKAPDWLIALLLNRKYEAPPRQVMELPANCGGTSYGKAAFAGLIDQMRLAIDGNWNNSVNTVAFRFGQLVAVNELPATAGEYLKQAARETGTAKPGDETKLQKTFCSGFEAGLRNPYGAPPRQANSITTVKAVPQFPNSEPPAVETIVNIVRGSDLTIKAIDWLWFDYLAMGKLHVLCGRPGCGKTTIMLKLAAAATSGEGWPDGSTSEPGNVVVWSGEDDPADTLIPRLVMSGAKIDRVYFVRGTTDIDGSREFDPSTDIELLRREIRRIGNVRLLLIDPLVSIVRGDDHKNGIVRRSIQPLADLAASENVATLGVSHFTKNSAGKDPVDRVTGSLAYGAAARVVLVAATQKDNAARVICRAKSNIGSDEDGFFYELKQDVLPDHPEITASYVVWSDAVKGAARDILAQAEEVDDSGNGAALTEAKDFIFDLLKDGAVSANEVKKQARGADISETTLRRAREALGIKPRKIDMKDGWEWSLAATRRAEDVHEERRTYQ